VAKKYNAFEGLDFAIVDSLESGCQKFGLDFDVIQEDLRYSFNGEDIVSPNNRQNLRADDGRPLGVVGLRYTPVPYPIAFSPASPLLENGAKIIGGGSTEDGARGFLVMEYGDYIEISPGVRIVNRFVMVSTHDGSGKIEVRMTPYLDKAGTAYTVDASHPLSFKHTLKVGDRINRARRIYSSVMSSWGEFANGVRKMLSVPITDTEAREFIEMVLPTPKGEGAGTRLENTRMDVYTIYKHTGIGTRLPQCRGTLFGVVQAFIEWADLHKEPRTSNKRSARDAAINSRLIADNAKKKQKAWATGLYLAKKSKISKLGGVSGVMGK
jgi:phage/plasmid-like protein (TIGR03299 family)